MKQTIIILWQENETLSIANYGVENEINYNTEVLKSNICDYNDVYILVRCDILSE